MHKKLISQIFPLILALFLGGCSVFDEFIQIGPDSVQDSRGEFNQVISDTNDSQSLLNLVKRRYGDSISVLEVSSVSTSIEWQRGGSLALTIWRFSKIHRETNHYLPAFERWRLYQESP